jgi:hypothetical protein
MLTDQKWENIEEDIGKGVQQHDQNTGPEQPVSRRGPLKEDFWVPEAQTCDGEERVVLGNSGYNSLSGGDKRGCNWRC